MNRYLWTIGLCLLTAPTAVAQTSQDGGPREQVGPEGQDGPGDRGRGDPGGRRFRRRNPLFEAIDADGDRVISKSELRKAVAAIKTLDADGDGEISLEEASPQRGAGGGPFGDPSQSVDRLMENDADGDGKLTPDEVPERMGRMLQGADTNGDGAIDREELGAAMENLGNRFRDRERGRGGRGGPGGGDPQQLVRQMLTYDENGDGVLTPNEVPEEAVQMVRGADTDGNGQLDAEELAVVAERMIGRRRGFGGRRSGFGLPGGEDGPEGERGGRGDRPQRPDSQ